MIKILNSLYLSLITTVLLFGVASGASVSVMHGWPAQQGEAFNKIVSVFEKKHPDIEVIVEVVGRDRPAVLAARLAAGNPPDITPHPWLALQADWARSGQIVSMEGLVDSSALLDALEPLGYVDGKIYGLFVFPNIKSLIWYNNLLPYTFCNLLIKMEYITFTREFIHFEQ
ncbi:MAG TPA: extracellular solute-binding protein, partial [Deltaproteobacteria bacterium]|nr:extracellular solute-binding protein [Deltaproteobacteria bacterium]